MEHSASNYHPYKDSLDSEISLVDVAVGIWKHRWFGLAVFCGVLALGVAAALLLPEKYLYTTVIELGSTDSDVVEPSAAVKAKLENAYIPAAARKIDTPADVTRSGLAVEVKLTKLQNEGEYPANLIILQSTATDALKAVYFSLHGAIAQAVIRDHAQTTDYLKSTLVNQLEKARLRLADLQDPATLANKAAAIKTSMVHEKIALKELQDPDIYTVKRQQLENDIAAAQAALKNYDDRILYINTVIAGLTKTESLLSSQIESVQAYIKESKARSLELTANSDGKDNAMALLLLDTKLQSSIDQLAGLEQRLYTTIPNKRVELNNQLEDLARQKTLQTEKIQLLESELNKWLVQHERSVQKQQPVVNQVEAKLASVRADFQRSIKNQQLAIQLIQARIENIRPTELVTPPQQSLKPVGMSTVIIVALSAVLATFLAIAAALLASFLEAVKAKLDTVAAPSVPGADAGSSNEVASKEKEVRNFLLAHPKKHV